MGRPKATLDWRGEPLVTRVAGIVRDAVNGPVVVVRAPGQEVPQLPRGVEVVADAQPGRGPLEGIAAGLRALTGRADAAYVSGTDVPLLQPAFIRRLADALGDEADAVVPRVEGRLYPLSGVYRVQLLAAAEALLAAGRLRASLLSEEARTVYLDEDDLLSDPALAEADPELRSLDDLDDETDYARALAG